MNSKIALKLKSLREENGYSVEELAKKIDVSVDDILEWESGEENPEIENVISLANLYGVSTDEVLNYTVKARTEGINLTDDEGQTVSVKNGKVEFINKDGSKEEVSIYRKVKIKIDALVATLITIMFFLLGLYYGVWGTAWILFLFIPIINSGIESVYKKRVSEFAYPLLVVAVYVFVGITCNLWHPWWWTFLTIPAFYFLANILDTYVLKSTVKLTDIDKNKDEDD